MNKLIFIIIHCKRVLERVADPEKGGGVVTHDCTFSAQEGGGRGVCKEPKSAP